MISMEDGETNMETIMIKMEILLMSMKNNMDPVKISRMIFNNKFSEIKRFLKRYPKT